MEIDEIQNKIMKIAEKISEESGCKLEAELSWTHLMEEVGEIAREFFNKKARPEKFDEKNLKEEVCDVILESLVLAKLLNVDISEALNKKINKLNERHGFK